jgi:hypothetical protein
LLLLSLPLLFSLLQLLFSYIIVNVVTVTVVVAAVYVAVLRADAHVDVDKFGGTSVAEHFTKVNELAYTT